MRRSARCWRPSRVAASSSPRGDDLPLHRPDEGFGQRGRAGQGREQLATRGQRQRFPAVERLVGQRRPSRPGRRPARRRTWISRGWSAASRPGMIASARSGRPRASTSRADEPLGDRDGPKWPWSMPTGQSGASRSSGPSARPAARRPGYAAGCPSAPARRPGPRAGSSRRFASVRDSGRRSSRSSAASSGRLVAGPDDRGALRQELGSALRRRDPIAQGDERESRLGQPAEDRQPHPGVGRIPGGDPTQGLQGGRLRRGSDRPGPARPGAGPGSRGRRPGGSSSRVGSRLRSGPAGSPPPRGARARAGRDAGRWPAGGRSARDRTVPIPSSVHRAWSRARGFGDSFTTARSRGRLVAGVGSRVELARSTSSRCAVVRHQALRLPSSATSVRSSALRRFGRRAGVGGVGLRPDAPDPPAVVPAAEVDGPSGRLGHELGMLDQLAVHVDDVERPVRAVRQVDRPECRVGRCQELAALLDPAGDERHAGRFEHATVHQVLSGSQTKALPR